MFTKMFTLRLLPRVSTWTLWTEGQEQTTPPTRAASIGRFWRKNIKRWLFSSVNRRLRPLPCSAPVDERHVLSPPQSNLAAPKIAGGRHAHLTRSHSCLSRMLLENDRLALVWFTTDRFAASHALPGLPWPAARIPGSDPQRGAEGASGRISGPEQRDRARHTLSPYWRQWMKTRRPLWKTC